MTAEAVVVQSSTTEALDELALDDAAMFARVASLAFVRAGAAAAATATLRPPPGPALLTAATRTAVARYR